MFQLNLCRCPKCTADRAMRLKYEMKMERGEIPYVISSHGRLPVTPDLIEKFKLKDRQEIDDKLLLEMAELVKAENKQNDEQRKAARDAMLQSVISMFSSAFGEDNFTVVEVNGNGDARVVERETIH